MTCGTYGIAGQRRTRALRGSMVAWLSTPWVPCCGLFVIGLVVMTPSDERSLFRLVMYLVAVLCFAAGVHYAAAQWARARMRRQHYRSGDMRLVTDAVDDELQAGTASCRLRALALAGLGDFAAARRDLLGDQGSSQEDQEIRLCVHILMFTFEGQALAALSLCRRMVHVPISGPAEQRARRQARRDGIVAIVRAVSGTADEDDYQALSRASTFEPSLYWACRYGAAVACCAKSEPELAYRLVAGAPRWPKESVFCLLHSRIAAFAG